MLRVVEHLGGEAAFDYCAAVQDERVVGELAYELTVASRSQTVARPVSCGSWRDGGASLSSWVMAPGPGTRWNGGSAASESCKSPMNRFQEILRRLAMIDEGFVEDGAGLGLGPAGTAALDPRTVALLRLGASVAMGSSAVSLEWSATRATAAGATDDEIAEVLLAIAPVTGLGRVASAAPDVATALGYDIAAALEEPEGY